MVGACIGNVEPYFEGDYFYLKELFVLPQYQHKGIGGELLTSLKKHLATIDIEMIILFTSNESFPYQFYLKQGFGGMQGMTMMALSLANGQ